MSELLSRGIKVPDDIAVIGYDNMSISQFVSPKLTTVDSNYEIVGEKMINMLLDLIEKRDSRRTGTGKYHIIKPHLVVRESA
jgi:DNA-binding LacI/PurR family transcriptional regulator